MCSIDWGLVVNSAAALGSIAAAIVALVIATRDRRERHREREAADKAQAELVVVDVKLARSRAFEIGVTNFGTSAILDLQFEDAQFATVKDSKAKQTTERETYTVLDNDRRRFTFYVDFVNNVGRSVLPGTFDEAYSTWTGDDSPDSGAVTAYVTFRDSEGNRWRRGNRGSAERLPATKS